MGHSCGCCSDSPLEVWPYLETDLGKIYSDPPKFAVGEKNDYFDMPWEGWDKKLRSACISETIINAISIYFQKEEEKSLASEDAEDIYNDY